VYTHNASLDGNRKPFYTHLQRYVYLFQHFIDMFRSLVTYTYQKRPNYVQKETDPCNRTLYIRFMNMCRSLVTYVYLYKRCIDVDKSLVTCIGVSRFRICIGLLGICVGLL